MSRFSSGPNTRLRALVAGRLPDTGVPLDRVDLPLRLETTLAAVSEEMSLLWAGSLVWPAMDDVPERRYGRVVAAQLAALAIRGHLWFAYGGEYMGPPGLMASLHPDAPAELAPEERMLMGIVFGDEQTVRIASRTDARSWDALARLLDEQMKAAGLGRTRLDRYRILRLLLRLRRWMREYRSVAGDWDTNPRLHLAGYPYAVLFGIENGPLAWPTPPEEEVYLPSLLPVACDRAINNVAPEDPV